MSALGLRGGVPSVFRTSIPIAADGRHHRFGGPINAMVARNKGANVIRMYFTEKDLTNDVNFVELPPASTAEPFGQWSGPVELREIWLKALTAPTDIELVSFQRRG